MEARSLPHVDGVDHRFVNLPGLTMHIAEAGAGEPLILLHGFPQHWWEWRDVIPALARDYHLICPDIRGAGWSDAPKSSYTAAELVGDLLALVDALGIDKARLVAHDYGAIVAQLFTFENPNRVVGTLSLSAGCPFTKATWAILPMLPETWFLNVLAIPWVGQRVQMSGRQRVLRYMLGPHFEPDRRSYPPERDEMYLERFRDPARARAGSLVYRRFILPSAMRVLTGRFRERRLEKPVAVLLGEKDPFAALEKMDHWPGHEDDVPVEFLAHSGHYIPEDVPDVLGEKIKNFFAQVPG